MGIGQSKPTYDPVDTFASTMPGALKLVAIHEFSAVRAEPLQPIRDERLFLFELNGMKVYLSYNQEQTIGRCEIRSDKPGRIHSKEINEKLFKSWVSLWASAEYVEIICDSVTYVIPRYEVGVEFDGRTFKDKTCGKEVCINPRPTNKAKREVTDATRLAIHKALKASVTGEVATVTTDLKHIPTSASSGPQPPLPPLGISPLSQPVLHLPSVPALAPPPPPTPRSIPSSGAAK